MSLTTYNSVLLDQYFVYLVCVCQPSLAKQLHQLLASFFPSSGGCSFPSEHEGC